MVDLIKVSDSLVNGKADEVRDMVKKAIDEEQDVEKILNEGLISGMDILGDKFKRNEFYVPEMLIAAREKKALIVGLCALLTTTMPSMKDVVKAFGELRHKG